MKNVFTERADFKEKRIDWGSLVTREDITPQIGSISITLVAQIASVYKMYKASTSYLPST